MRVVIQRVSRASVDIKGVCQASIGMGMVILLGIEYEDTQDDINWLAQKITALRIFSDTENRMNLSIQEIQGEILVISQFTLHASTKKGNRPSFLKAARPEIAIPLYEAFLMSLKTVSGLGVQTGLFGADMQVTLANNGPVTIIMDSKQRE